MVWRIGGADGASAKKARLGIELLPPRTNTGLKIGQTAASVSDGRRWRKRADGSIVIIIHGHDERERAGEANTARRDVQFVIDAIDEQEGRRAMYSKILVPLDGSELGERAIPHAEEIGKLTKAEIILFRVVQNPIRSVPIAAGQKEESKATRETTDKAGTYLQKVAAPLTAKGIKVRCDVEVGEATGRILDKAHNENVDLIVMSTHYDGELYKAVIGSVAEKVLLGTKRPVLLAKPERVHLAHHVDEQEVFGRKSS